MRQPHNELEGGIKQDLNARCRDRCVVLTSHHGKAGQQLILSVASLVITGCVYL